MERTAQVVQSGFGDGSNCMVGMVCVLIAAAYLWCVLLCAVMLTGQAQVWSADVVSGRGTGLQCMQ